MIQRIQSLYFLIASLLLIWIAINQPLAQITLDTANKSEIQLSIGSYGFEGKAQMKNSPLQAGENFKSVHFSKSMLSKNYPFYILFYLIAAGIIATIFLYKNQKNQLRVAKIMLFLLVLSLSTLTLLLMVSPQSLVDYYQSISNEDWNSSVQILFGSYLLCIALVLVVMGIYGIKKDIRLVKSLDRIR